MYCSTCGTEMNFIEQYQQYYCFNCKKYQPPPLPTPPPHQQQPPPLYYSPSYQAPPSQQYYPSKPKKSRTGLIIGIVIVIVFLIIFIPILLNYILPQAGINITTGELKVRYNSVWGGDIEIKIDDESKGTHPSDTFITFDGISPGTHKVEAYDLDGNYLHGETVEVKAGETTTVELSYF